MERFAASDGKPKYRRLPDAIIQLISVDALPSGTRFPPDNTMAAELGVSLGTVQKAPVRLEARGLFRAISALLCYGLAPWLAETLNGGRPYRLLRDSAPWKFPGFVLAAPALIRPMVALSEHRVSLRGALFVGGSVAILLVVFGTALPDTFLLPNAEY